jgi:hypothetical protein
LFPDIALEVLEMVKKKTNLFCASCGEWERRENILGYGACALLSEQCDDNGISLNGEVLTENSFCCVGYKVKEDEGSS